MCIILVTPYKTNAYSLASVADFGSMLISFTSASKRKGK